MAAKKDTKKTESKSNNKPMNGEPWKDESWRRHEVVDPKLVLSALEKNGLKVAEKELDRTADLSSFYVHEKQKKTMKLARCVPNDADDPLGCGFMSDETLDSCPFCGSGDEIVSVPKEAPKADRDVELNVKAAAKKVEDKKSGGAVKVTSKDVKAKKKERGEVVEEKPTEPAKEATKPDAIVSAKPEVVAIDLPSESAGGTVKDLEQIEQRVDEVTEGMLTNQALSMWELGTLLAEIRDKKLWSLARHESDGGYKYLNFNSYVAQRFDFTPDHAMLMIRIAGSMTREDALIGIAKAKAILDAKLPDDMTAQLVSFASEKDERGNFIHSVVELRLKIKGLKNPQLPAASSQPVVATSTDDDEDDEDRDDEDSDDDDEDDWDDDDSDLSRPAAKPTVRQPQMTSVSFEKKEFSIGLVQKGSQIKAAKKIQDEPHGTLSVPGGTKIHFVLKIGDDGQIFVEGKIETPY
jgi:hypothetical protein